MTQSSLNWWSSPRAMLRHVLTLDDTAHNVALGTAIGMFIGMTPTVGVQMVLVLLLAAATRQMFTFNRIAALVAVYVSNPITTVPIYWFNYRIGTLFFPATVGRSEFARLLRYDSFSEWWNTIVSLFVKVGAPLLAGSLVVATVCGVITYPLMRALHDWFHNTTDRLAEAHAMRRQQKQSGEGQSSEGQSGEDHDDQEHSASSTAHQARQVKETVPSSTPD